MCEALGKTNGDKMKKEIISIEGIAKPQGPFSLAVKAGGFIFLTGQLSVDLKTNKIIAGDIKEQTRKTLDNIKFLLEKAGCGMEDIVKIAVYMKNINDFDKMNEIYRKYFKEGEEPARVTVQAVLPYEQMEIEIEATAIAREKE